MTPLARGSDSLNASHFRDYFIPLPGCFSPFPHGTIRYRSLHIFSLGWWSTQIPAGLHVSDRTQEHSSALQYFGDGALTLYGRPFQGRLPIMKSSHVEVLQPPIVNYEVWADPCSLATTKGISYDFFSSVT